MFCFSFPFHSFPVLSFVLSREQAQQMSTHLPLASSAASIGKGYPFRKNPRFDAIRRTGISLVESFPNPFTSSHSISRPTNGFCCTLPLTIYNTQTFIFAKRFRERFAKFFYTVYWCYSFDRIYYIIVGFKQKGRARLWNICHVRKQRQSGAFPKDGCRNFARVSAYPAR